MVVLSVLRAVTQSGLRAARPALLRSNVGIVSKDATNSLVLKRLASGRKMEFLPSRYEWTRWKDQAHFFFLLGFLPMGALILYCNIFIGPAELVDIPEDYEPKHWEYYKHPIQRWFSRYVYGPPQKSYEKTLHHINEVEKTAKMYLLERKVKELMAERGDYKGWYYIPANERRILVSRYERQEIEESSGSS